jgi:hypothetical protein
LFLRGLILEAPLNLPPAGAERSEERRIKNGFNIRLRYAVKHVF